MPLKSRRDFIIRFIPPSFPFFQLFKKKMYKKNGDAIAFNMSYGGVNVYLYLAGGSYQDKMCQFRWFPIDSLGKLTYPSSVFKVGHYFKLFSFFLPWLMVHIETNGRATAWKRRQLAPTVPDRLLPCAPDFFFLQVESIVWWTWPAFVLLSYRDAKIYKSEFSYSSNKRVKKERKSRP